MSSLGFVHRSVAGVLFSVAFSGACVLPAVAFVHAGDQLDVKVYNHPDLSEKVTVDASETISLPLAGRVNVRGLETPGIARRVAAALDPYFKSPAAVEVALAGRPASLFLSGGPGGVLKYEPGESLAAALASVPGVDGTPASTGLAGLQRSRVDLRDVSVVRDGSSLGKFDVLALSAHGQSGPSLQPGDTIVFTDKPHVVHVLGDVVDPGSTFVSSDETLADALQQAGGVRETAASSDITFERGGTTHTIALGDPDMRSPAQDGDVLTVPTAPRVSVAGFVMKPGQVVLKSNLTLLSALYEAGGPVKTADLSKVQVFHDGERSTLNLGALKRGDISQNPMLSDGDLVFVPDGGSHIDFAQLMQTISPIFYLLPRP